MPSAEAYRDLVERLEREARRSPGRYKWKVALWAVAGFLVLGGTLLFAFGISAGLVVGLALASPLLLLKLAKVVWIPVAFGWLVLKSLWVKFSPPDGHVLGPHEAPELRAQVERLRTAAGAPALEAIVIDADFNAGAASVPRAMGLLGHRHYLVLGLPLMQALDREQFLAVVAHEFGHFGGGHGRFSGWIYQVRLSWYRLLHALSEQGAWSARLFVRFFRWYAPYFNAYSFVLARDTEYQADATAARLVGPDAIGHALIRTSLGGERLQREFWPRIDAISREQAEPPPVLYREMAASLRSRHPEDAERLDGFLGAESDLEDTHPTLAQRLGALAVPAREIAAPAVSSAEALLGDLVPMLEERFSAQWSAQARDPWQARYRQHQADLERLAALERDGARSPDEHVEHARLVEEIRPDEDAVPAYRTALEHAPDDAFARFRLGALLLARGEPAGESELRRAMALDADCATVALMHLEAFHRTRGDAVALAGVERESERLGRAQAGAMRARNGVSLRDTFLPHGLDADALAGVRAALRGDAALAKAWLVRKVLPGDTTGIPHFVLLVRLRGLVMSEQAALQRIVDAVDVPGSLVVLNAPHNRLVARRIRKTCREPIHTR